MSDITEADAALVAQVRAGSREAADRLVDRYLRTCRAVALVVVGDIAAAEDVTQEAFVYAIERIDECRDPDRFGAWLRQIVRSRARNHVRYSSLRRTEPLLDDTAASGAESPAEAAERADLAGHLLAALETLPEDRREVVLLHDLEGWTHRDIAEHMGLPAATVRSHLHLARKRLREQLTSFREHDS